MFEIPRLIGTPREERRIVVQTKMGNEVEAFVGPDASTQCRNGFEAYLRQRPNAEERKAACGGYNCAGMVWAARRAILPRPEDWERILVEDGFRHIEDAAAHIGDIVVYRNDVDEITHIGRVCAMDQLLIRSDSVDSASARRVFMVLSKLGATMGEVIHRRDDILLEGGEGFVSQVYTDR
jgi:hypothetical protein